MITYLEWIKNIMQVTQKTYDPVRPAEFTEKHLETNQNDLYSYRKHPPLQNLNQTVFFSSDTSSYDIGSRKFSHVDSKNLQSNEGEGASDSEEDVSKEFVENFNAHIGNFSNQKKALRLIKKMRRLGGLITPLKDELIDIPAARMGLSILAGVNKLSYKMQSLDDLILLLKKDKIEKDTSIGLVALAINLMGQMNRVLMQTETVDVQIKITLAYSLVAELIQRHFSKKHINAITKELKIELIQTIKALEDLNAHENARLNFHVNLALEGLKRIVDDRKELFDLIERFYRLAAAIVLLERYDAASCFIEMGKVFKDLSPSIPNVWYNGVLILRDLAKVATSDIDKLIGIQSLVRDKYKTFNWKFAYAALEIFHDIAIKGSSKKIRKQAFEGIKIFGPDFPGLLSFVNCNQLPTALSLKPMLHFKRPIHKNPNIEIRYAAIEYLISVSKNSPDYDIRKKARMSLLLRSRIEKNAAIVKLIEESIPIQASEQMKWLRENGVNTKNVVKIHRRKGVAKSKIDLS